MKIKAWVGWGIALGVLLLLYLFGASALRAQMEAALSSACNRPVFVQSAHMVLPPGIRLSGITVPALEREPVQPLSIGEIQARLVVSDLLQGRRGIELEIRRPKLRLAWTPQARALFSLAGLKGTSGPVPLPLARLRIEGGEVTLADETVIPATDWNLRDFQGEVSAAPAPHEYRYKFSGLLVGDTQARPGNGADRRAGEDLGRVEAEGTWVSGGPFDGKILIQHRGLRMLSPYLRRVLGASPSAGTAELITHLTIHQGVVMAHNDVTAQGLVFPSGASTTLDLEGNRLVELLRDEEGKVHLSFIVAGKLGGKLDWSDLATSALREAMRQALTRSIQKALTDTEVKPLEELIRRGLESIGR